MKRIMIDVDGVLADFIQGFTMIGWSLFGSSPYSVFDQQKWDEFKGLNKEQVKKVWEEVHKNPIFWNSLPACAPDSAFDVIERMANDGYDFYFVTNRSSRNAKIQTERWLMDHGISSPTVVTTAKKGEMARALDAHYSLEDKPENADCIAWMTDKKTESFIIERPYNTGQYAPHSSKVKRVLTVEEFLSYIRTASAEKSQAANTHGLYVMYQEC